MGFFNLLAPFFLPPICGEVKKYFHCTFFFNLHLCMYYSTPHPILDLWWIKKKIKSPWWKREDRKYNLEKKCVLFTLDTMFSWPRMSNEKFAPSQVNISRCVFNFVIVVCAKIWHEYICNDMCIIKNLKILATSIT
jgi:hypothetical protein